MQFFVLRVASNKEDQVREKLARKVKIEGLDTHVGRILVPTERVRTMKQGVRRESDRKLYPGYVFIELNLDMAPRLWVGERECTDRVSIYHGPLLLAYDPRFDLEDPTRLPEVNPTKSPSAIRGWTLAPEPILLLRFATRDGTGMTLCDFASAGAAGNRYVSWIPASNLIPAPFARDNPLRFSQCLILCPQPQFAFADRLDQHLVARLQTSRCTTFRRDHNPALLVDARPTRHDTISNSVRIV